MVYLREIVRKISNGETYLMRVKRAHAGGWPDNLIPKHAGDPRSESYFSNVTRSKSIRTLLKMSLICLAYILITPVARQFEELWVLTA